MDVVEVFLRDQRENANVGNSPSAKRRRSPRPPAAVLPHQTDPRGDVAGASQRGIHIHDLDFYGKTLTCVQIPLKRLLEEGFNTGYGYIRRPNGRPRPRPWLPSSCKVRKTTCTAASPSLHSIPTWPPLWTALRSSRFTGHEAVIYNLKSCTAAPVRRFPSAPSTWAGHNH